MSESPDRTNGDEPLPEADSVAAAGSDMDASHPAAIPLPPVDGQAPPGVLVPPEAAGFEPTIPPRRTSQIPPVGPGSSRLTGGTQTRPGWDPQWGGAPAYLGWPLPAAGARLTPARSARSRKGLAIAFAVMAVVAGVGLGHVTWPSSSSGTASPAVGSGGSPGSSGGGSFPSGPGSDGGGFGSGGFGDGSSSPNSGSGNSAAAGAPEDISAVAGKVSPALVDINTNLSYQGGAAAGTGMVLASNGVVLTNNHVIDGATSISATDIGNGKTYQAHVVGYDRTGDVAVIQLSNASGLQAIAASNAAPAVGEAVVGVGNAGGAGGTPSAAGGSITGLNQSITASDVGGSNAEDLTGLIETNAGIQAGDSGGSLVNTQGQVIGMDTAASADSRYQESNQAYSIPIQTAVTVAHQITAGVASSVIHIGPTAFLGIGVSGASGRGFFGDNAQSGSSGSVVSDVLPHSAAGQAGVAVGDTIVSFDGSSVNSPSDLTNLLAPKHPGDSVQVEWTDQSGQTHAASVTLGSGPPA